MKCTPLPAVRVLFGKMSTRTALAAPFGARRHRGGGVHHAGGVAAEGY